MRFVEASGLQSGFLQIFIFHNLVGNASMPLGPKLPSWTHTLSLSDWRLLCEVPSVQDSGDVVVRRGFVCRFCADCCVALEHVLLKSQNVEDESA